MVHNLIPSSGLYGHRHTRDICMVLYTLNSNAQEAEVDGWISVSSIQPGLQNKFQGIQDYVEKLFQK